MTFERMQLVGRWVLGLFYLTSGLNWIFGYISVLPHIGMPEDLPIRHVVVAEMVKTGWMYQSAKVLEIVGGAALLSNRFVPLGLAVTLPVVFITSVLGVTLILHDIGGVFTGTVAGATLLTKILQGALGGTSALLLHLWLMLGYFDYYRSMLPARAVPKEID